MICAGDSPEQWSGLDAEKRGAGTGRKNAVLVAIVDAFSFHISISGPDRDDLASFGEQLTGDR